MDLNSVQTKKPKLECRRDLLIYRVWTVVGKGQ